MRTRWQWGPSIYGPRHYEQCLSTLPPPGTYLPRRQRRRLPRRSPLFYDRLCGPHRALLARYSERFWWILLQGAPVRLGSRWRWLPCRCSWMVCAARSRRASVTASWRGAESSRRPPAAALDCVAATPERPSALRLARWRQRVSRCCHRARATAVASTARCRA